MLSWKNGAFSSWAMASAARTCSMLSTWNDR